MINQPKRLSVCDIQFMWIYLLLVKYNSQLGIRLHFSLNPLYISSNLCNNKNKMWTSFDIQLWYFNSETCQQAPKASSLCGSVAEEYNHRRATKIWAAESILFEVVYPDLALSSGSGSGPFPILARACCIYGSVLRSPSYIYPNCSEAVMIVWVTLLSLAAFGGCSIPLG